MSKYDLRVLLVRIKELEEENKKLKELLKVNI